MRASLTLSLIVVVLHFTGSGVSAQPYNAGIGMAAPQQYLAPPRAPDMLNPGYYYNTQNGMIYGPNYNVYPCFSPFQGAVLGPTMPLPQQAGNMTSGCWPNRGAANFPSHLFIRSPRDFFMVETDPRSSPPSYSP